MAGGTWVPWSMLLALLPAGAAELVKEEERERRREELAKWLQDASQAGLKWSVRAAQVLAGVAFLFVTATVLYSIVYYLVIPARLHEQEIFFDYGDHAALAKHGLPARFTLPTATLNLLDAEHQWDASPLVQLPTRAPPVLVPGVTYDVFIELTVPESRANVEIGMFMVSTTLKSFESEVLAASARPAIVHEAHALVRWLRVGAMAFSHALGLTEPSQLLHILAINGLQESKTHPLTTVVVRLNHPQVQVYAAKLTIIAQLSGVRYLMYHWAVSTAVLVIVNIVFLEAVALVILFAFVNLPAAAEDEAAALAPAATRGIPVGVRVGVDEDLVQRYEPHRSGAGVPPVHVERKVKREPPVESASSATAPPKTMQQIMDEELAHKLEADERAALAKRMADDEAVALELAALDESDDESDGGNSNEGYEQDDDDDDDDSEYDYMDSYSVGSGKSVQTIGQYVPLANTTKGFNSLRESMRRQNKGESRKGPVRSVLKSSKFASRDSAFDERTRMVLLKLMNRGKLDVVYERINTGKEANTYRAVGSGAESGRERHFAVKIFKTARGDFAKANECDPSGRVYNETFIKKTLRRQLKEWTEKEYKNLLRAASCGVQAPRPLLFKDHVLAMHFVGEGALAAPKLKDATLTRAELSAAYVDVLRSVRTLYQNAQLVHARLSESNILYHDNRCWLVDFSEAMQCSHPDHDEALDRDLAKLHGFFESRGLRRAHKDSPGLLSLANAREFVTSEDPEIFLKYYPGLKAALLVPAAS
ncbi:hypothetical protein PybrP1_008584 [[Pythium] brassicae (nom. inval.)]|nr:hypothetical protein PybrP1_008584 [[Pythium] brassicae (nom. inval.)]